MPLFIDIHEVPGITSEEAAAGHVRDLQVQDQYNVNYSRYWFNRQTGKIFCFCEAPDVESAIEVHRVAHGTGAERIIEVTADMVELFLGNAGVDAAGAVLLPATLTPEPDPGVRTVLFTDIADSTGLTQRIGDEAALELIKAHDRIVRDSLREHGGREIKHTGDGLMAAFTSTAAAVRCAIDVQHALARLAEERATEVPAVRIGACAGEPVEHSNDLFGVTVQLAARLCAHAQPGEILVSSAVAELCAGKGLRFREVGAVELKGFERPVEVRAVDWHASKPAA